MLPKNEHFGNTSWYIIVEQLLEKLENSIAFRKTSLEVFANPVKLK
jgi:hypothetical protein